ncbi:MAG: putative lipid II flippase FtsW [Rickettsiales bacterium]|nr:putative lipid II flippase FtsW [Rickettsiales bacterium]|tara:strand:+ start:1481 stop:2599 length:1119 start_codon:yes stop_codon:yes gene_type:complete
MLYDRANASLIGRWWWTVDRPTWFALLLLLVIGAVLVTTASPAVAARIGLGEFHFAQRHYVFLFLTLLTMFGISLLSHQQVRQLAMLTFALAIVCLLLLPVIGFENKGATRWIRIAGLSIQPSEFLKPAFAVFVAWLFAEKFRSTHFPGYRLAIGVYLVCAALLITQPDFGMTVVLTGMFALQFFLAGVSVVWVGALVGFALVGALLAYELLPHVTERIDRFLDPASGDNYQVEKSLDAFASGGFIGRGPGEGTVKEFIPDSHTDFIFAVAGEEYGMLVCLMILGIYAFILLRGFKLIQQRDNLFVILAVAGLLTQFGLQALINMGVAVNLLPAKGMTLPFLSYGGSSSLAMGITMGMLLALTRKQYGVKRV